MTLPTNYHTIMNFAICDRLCWLADSKILRYPYPFSSKPKALTLCENNSNLMVCPHCKPTTQSCFRLRHGKSLKFCNHLLDIHTIHAVHQIGIQKKTWQWLAAGCKQYRNTIKNSKFIQPDETRLLLGMGPPIVHMKSSPISPTGLDDAPVSRYKETYRGLYILYIARYILNFSRLSCSFILFHPNSFSRCFFLLILIFISLFPLASVQIYPPNLKKRHVETNLPTTPSIHQKPPPSESRSVNT